MDFSNTRALLIGAGGIGCELLKTLCLHTFKEIFIVLISLPPKGLYLAYIVCEGRLGHNRFI